METIQQTPPSKSVNQATMAAKLAAIDGDNFFTDYSTNMYDTGSNGHNHNFHASLEPAKDDLEFVDAVDFEKIEPIGSVHSNITSMFNSGENNRPNMHTSKASSSWKTTTTNNEDLKNTMDENTAQKRFGNAKGFGSAQFFADKQFGENTTAKLARFQGSNAISSADYFNDETNASNYNAKSICLM